MSRMIDADALMDIYANRLKLLVMRYGLDSTACGVLSGAMKLLETQPTIEPDRPTGQWIEVDRPIESSAICECSQCKHTVWKYEGENVADMWRFCPKCGAKMENGA